MGNIVKSTEYQINYHDKHGDIVNICHEDRKPAAIRMMKKEIADLPMIEHGIEIVAISIEKVISHWDKRDCNLEDRDFEMIARHPEDLFAEWDLEDVGEYSF